MNHPSILSHPHVGTAFWGAAVINYIITAVSDHGPFLQGLASIATIAAAAVGIYFTIRNRKR
jgi:hypothetical protein